MTSKEKSFIRGQIGTLRIFLDAARAEKEKALDKGNWEHVYYWNGRIEQVNETLDFLNQLTDWEFYK